jgi:hypothetical protein
MRAVLFAVLLVACKKDDPGPTCEQVTDHMLDVTKQQLPGHEGMTGLGDRKAMITQCTQRSMTKEQRECLMAAKSLDGFGGCYKGPANPRASIPARRRRCPPEAPVPAAVDRGTPRS